MTTIIITNENQLTTLINTYTTIIFGASFTITNNTNFITISGSNIIIDGRNNTLTITSNNFAGLIQNITNTNTNILIKNINIISTSALDSNGGWLCQSNFQNGNIVNCNSNGLISINGGGIFGQACYNCIATNCFSTGSIGQYAGGIFGSYSVNCKAISCYSIGTIGNYAGGIFGLGTNYTFDGSSYSPSVIVDQDGNAIANLGNPNNYGIITSSSAYNCYSVGSIGKYSGGIFGYFAYKSIVNNCYTLGNGNTGSGGIFAYNFYEFSSIIIPTDTSCTANSCYTIGNSLSGDGIFCYNITNIVSNVKIMCFSEQYDSINFIPMWNDKNANKILYGLGKFWIDIDKKLNNIPWLLLNFNQELYIPNYKKIKCKKSKSIEGILVPTYDIISINNKKVKKNISINNDNGQLTFNKVKYGKYKINIINGIKIIITNNYGNYYIYSNYNINYFYLKSAWNDKSV